MTAEADSPTTDAKQLLEDYGLAGCHSKRGNYLSFYARIDPTGCIRLLWDSNEEEDKGSHAAIFEVKFGNKAEGSFTDSRERTADTLFCDFESVASLVESSDLKDTFVRAYGELYSRHQGKAPADQIRSSRNSLLCVPSPS